MQKKRLKTKDEVNNQNSREMIQFKKEAREMFQKMAAHIEFTGEYGEAI